MFSLHGTSSVTGQYLSHVLCLHNRPYSSVITSIHVLREKAFLLVFLMQFHRTSWTIRPARTWLCERGQTWRSGAPRRVHLSPVSPGVEKGAKLFPWATGKKVGDVMLLCLWRIAAQVPARGFPQGNILNLPNNTFQCHIHTQNCSNVTLDETPKIHEKQQIRTEVELEGIIVALGNMGNN